MGGRPRLASKERTRTWGTIRAPSGHRRWSGDSGEGSPLEGPGGVEFHLCYRLKNVSLAAPAIRSSRATACTAPTAPTNRWFPSLGARGHILRPLRIVPLRL